MSKTKLTLEEVKTYAEANKCTLGQARDRLNLLRSNTDRALWIKRYCAKTGKSLAAGAYAYQQLKDGKPFDGYRFINGRGSVTFDEVKNFSIVKNDKALGGYDVYYHDKLVKNWFIERHLYVTNPNKGKGKATALAALVFIKVNNTEIPNGYVVDHKDNNPLNNDPANLQLISWSANVRKNAVGHNQYNTKR